MSSLRPEMNYFLSHRIIFNSQNYHKNACQDVKPKESRNYDLNPLPGYSTWGRGRGFHFESWAIVNFHRTQGSLLKAVVFFQGRKGIYMSELAWRKDWLILSLLRVCEPQWSRGQYPAIATEKAWSITNLLFFNYLFIHNDNTYNTIKT